MSEWMIDEAKRLAAEDFSIPEIAFLLGMEEDAVLAMFPKDGDNEYTDVSLIPTLSDIGAIIPPELDEHGNPVLPLVPNLVK